VGGSSSDGPAVPAPGGSSSRASTTWSSASDNLSRRLAASKSKKSVSFYDGVKAQFAKVADSLTPKPKTISASQPTSLNSTTGRVTPDLLVSTAQAHVAAGEYEKATQYYRRVLKKDPDHLGALLGYGHLLDWQNDLPAATVQYRKAAKHHPNSGKAHNDLGLCYARRRMFRESAESLRIAVRLEPTKKLYRNNLATVLVNTGQSQEALSHLVKTHGSAAAHYNVGFLLTKTGDMQRAEYHFTQALRADPSLEPARQWLQQLNAQRRAAAPTTIRAATTTKPAMRPQRPFASRSPAAKAPVPNTVPRFLSRDVAVAGGPSVQPSIRIPPPLTAPAISRDAAVAPTPDDLNSGGSSIELLPPIAVDDAGRRW
jgi:Tfp pilus assembly protein PilF